MERSLRMGEGARTVPHLRGGLSGPEFELLLFGQQLLLAQQQLLALLGCRRRRFRLRLGFGHLLTGHKGIGKQDKAGGMGQKRGTMLCA